MAKKVAPSGLTVKSRAVWHDVVAKFELRADELVMLEKACRALARIEAMEKELDGDVTATGSMGQLVVHPLILEIRAHEALIGTLFRGMRLPDESGSVQQPRSTQARQAAQSRWSVAHGAGA